MMRGKPSSSMQKTYDDCFLTCSTAVYFESQNNEAEALRSWRDALDTIYYHNAYKVPSGWRPRTETDKALQDSLKQMEIRCKERVDLLQALKDSRDESKKSSGSEGSKHALDSESAYTSKPLKGVTPISNPSLANPGWLGNGTIPPSDYASIPRPSSSQAPPLPARSSQSRPSFTTRRSSNRDIKGQLSPKPAVKDPFLASTESLTLQRPEPTRKISRTPSPEKKGMLRTLRTGKDKRTSSGKASSVARTKPPAAAKAATQAWGAPAFGSSDLDLPGANGHAVSTSTKTNVPPLSRNRSEDTIGRLTAEQRNAHGRSHAERTSLDSPVRSKGLRHTSSSGSLGSGESWSHDETSAKPPPYSTTEPMNMTAKPASSMPTYRQEYLPTQPSKYQNPPLAAPPRTIDHRASSAPVKPNHPSSPVHNRTSGATHSVPRKAVGVVAATQQRRQLDDLEEAPTATNGGSPGTSSSRVRRTRPSHPSIPTDSDRPMTSSSNDPPSPTDASSLSPSRPWEVRKAAVLAHLPANIDRTAAQQILNEVSISTQPVHWSDISGLAAAKAALKENVIYPFLRPDLFRGLRSPANGILLFGPPGTGKTMLARAVATESRSTFFAIGAGSLTSKFLGESEKLVRALFACARLAGPSIVFVDEIESLLGRRGEGAHDAVERVKTEFLVGWGELQAAVAASERGGPGSEGMGDPSRVLVLAATNLPWLIDEAARRRFVRRQYIPLPEPQTRKEQLVNLLEKQRHGLTESELDQLVRLTDGFSGSDMTSLAKDAAMGPLRALGERLLDMSPDDIRPIGMEDFKASLVNIRPSVGKAGLAEFEKWAKEFGERGG